MRSSWGLRGVPRLTAPEGSDREPITLRLDQQEHFQGDQPDRPRDVGKRHDRARQWPAFTLVGADELERAIRSATPMGNATMSSQPGSTAVDRIEAATKSVQTPVNR
jgi:hypothetical protein